MVWLGTGQEGSGSRISAQLYNADGAAQGSEFQVNTHTTNEQSFPTAAKDPAGDFVITWMSTGQDGSGVGIYAQRYNAAGMAQGVEFQVNTYTTDYQTQPSVAMDTAGDFMIAWKSETQG